MVKMPDLVVSNPLDVARVIIVFHKSGKEPMI